MYSTTWADRTAVAVWVLFLVLSVWASVATDRVFSRLVIGKFVIWAVLFAAARICSALVAGFVRASPYETEAILGTAQYAAVIGAGAGFGNELSVFICRRMVRRGDSSP